uniref:Uncharacterized protein n=1 Tax=Vespula pensylvanica TaxID=30213 RepID=A0A834KME3_VESPE|nr:hypothetical protein H0235_013211 [Vespula pensylvanica]
MQISWDIQFPNGYRVRGESSKLTRVECAPADGWAAASISRLLDTPCLSLETASESVRPECSMSSTWYKSVSLRTIDKGKIDSCLESSLIR